MSHPLFWLTKNFFYPIGNTAATCLTQDLSPEQSADILLLGCGDPRNILFTVYADVVATSGPRKMDITCCDIEPAILARNILLFSLLEDGVHVDRIWDIFYHFKINDSAQKILTQQSARLYENAETIDTWRESSYGSFLKLVDTRTLAELRRYWKNYAEFSRLPIEQLRRVEKEQSQKSKSILDKHEFNLSPSRSAGMLWAKAWMPVNELFRKYWETGTTFTLESDIKNAKHINPTFVYSVAGDTFNPHYGTFPQGFHLAPAFAPITSDPAGPVLDSGSSAISVSKQQFKAWCGAFGKSRAVDAIKIRFYAGDFLAFCRALTLFSTTGRSTSDIFISAWRAPQINLNELSASDPPAPISYDVIDTSNLTDHFGLLNILLAAQPLLKPSPASQSVLYTETLLPSGEDATRSYLERICTSVPTISVLLGLAPRPYVSGFTTHSNSHELISIKDVSQYHERVAWVDPIRGDHHTSQDPTTISFDAADLAQILFGLYEQMFSHEKFLEKFLARPSIAALGSMERIEYTRETMAMLFQLAKRRVHVSNGGWDVVANRFLQQAAQDISRMNYYQDLCLHFHLLGVHTNATLQPNWRVRFTPHPASTVFKDWPEVPPVLCVVFSVPRNNLLLFWEYQDKLGSPRLQCDLTNQGIFCNTFSAVHAVWGKCSLRKGSQVPLLVEDPMGMSGTSDLVVLFWAPSGLLEFKGAEVSLGIKHTPATSTRFAEKLGTELHLFTAKVNDKKRVHLLRCRPVLASETQQIHPVASSASPANVPSNCTISAIRKEAHVEYLAARLNIASISERESLLKGAKVSTAQLSPCSMKVSIERVQHIISFPYPINGVLNKLRIARRSHYIEVIVPVSKPFDSSGYFLKKFPILQQTAYSPWNIHHIHLERMPKLNLTDPKKLQWLNPHIAFQLSDRERAIYDEGSEAKAAKENVFVNIKESILALMMHGSGVQGTKARFFGLREPSKGGIYAILLMGGLRLDLASCTVVLDMALVPLSTKRMPVLMPRIQLLCDAMQVTPINTIGHEAVAWKTLLPAYVERCRTWTHKPNCEYKRHGSIPLSVDIDQNPICVCGEGLGFDSREWNVPAWNGLLQYATRIAISPLFSVSYIETVAGVARGLLQSAIESMENTSLSGKELSDACWLCGGPGKPELQACSRCKKARYCSSECQHRDWKSHKTACKSP